MDNHPNLTIEDIKSLIDQIHASAHIVANLHYVEFNEYPVNYNYANHYQLATMFSGLLLQKPKYNTDQIRNCLLFLLSSNQYVLERCIVHKTTVGQKYHRIYKNKVARNIDHDPNLHEALSLSAVKLRTTPLLKKWSDNIKLKGDLYCRIRKDHDPFNHDNVTGIVKLVDSYSEIISGYHSLNQELAKHIAARGKHLSDLLRTKLAISGLVLSSITAAVGVTWWLFGKSINQYLGIG